MSDFEAEREATIARNRALLAQLDVTLDIPKPKAKVKAPTKTRAKPVQPSVKSKKRSLSPIPLRQSKRLRRSVQAPGPDESPEQRRVREQEEEERRRKEEEGRLELEELARQAKKPRHEDLEMYTLLQDQEAEETMALTDTLQVALQNAHPRRVGDQTEFDYDDATDKKAVGDLKAKLKHMTVVARAKVTKERIYCAAYHPEVTKDLIFFGDKYGTLGIWDVRATPEADDGDNKIPVEQRGEGRHWRMQLHWPATPASSISSIKFNPLNAHGIFTCAYDRTVRSTSFESAISNEVFFNEDASITSMDIAPSGHELWLSDDTGAVTHLDLREDKSKARWYQLSDNKIGSVSINPADLTFILTASNSRILRVWDVRKLNSLTSSGTGPVEINYQEIEEHMGAKQNKDLMRGEWRHGKSVSSAYWDPHGRRIVSTSYDNTIKLWDVPPSFMKRSGPFPTFRPSSQFAHNCQSGKWVTILRAQWSPNPDVYPHFTIANMDHSLDIRTCKGDLVAKLQDKNKVTAVQAVTCSHPSIVERAASGNATGRCVLWAPNDP